MEHSVRFQREVRPEGASQSNSLRSARTGHAASPDAATASVENAGSEREEFE